MTEDDAIKIAHEIVREMGGVPDGTRLTPIVRALIRAAAAEREACAKACDEVAEMVTYQTDSQGAAEKCVNAIRARSNVG